MSSPRDVIEKMIDSGDIKGLLEKAGELHGHFCPFLALGVRAGVIGIKNLGVKTKGMENVLAILETNSCFADGIQMASGCSFGNNSLIYRDFGKTAVSFVRRDGEGVRIRVKVSDDWLNRKYPDAMHLFDKVVKRREADEKAEEKLQEVWQKISFDMLGFPDEELFLVKEVKIEVPEYAPILESLVCSECGEKVMESRTVKKDEKILCIPCSKEGFYQMDGKGISFCRGEKKQKAFPVYPIGYVESSFPEPDDPAVMREKESSLIIYPEYQEGLYKIEESDFLDVIFYFHRSSGYILKGKRRDGRTKGVFASRSPYRPSPLGLSRVKLLKREKNRLRVRGLDAINGTPMLDIKPSITSNDE